MRNLSRYWKTCVTLFIIALVIRVAICSTLDPSPFSLQMKKNDLAGQTLSISKFQPPLYPLFLRTVYGIFGMQNHRAVFILQGIASAFTVPLIFLIAACLGGTHASYAAGLIAALYPNFILHNLTLLESTFGIILNALLMLIMLVECEESHRAIAAAVTVGLGIMLMPVYLFFVPGLLIVLEKRKIFLAVLIIALLPLFIRNIKFHRKFVLIFHRYTWAIDIRKYFGETSRVLERLYNNATSLFKHPSRITHEEGFDTKLYAIRYVGFYSYIVLVISGFIGIIRFYRHEQRAIVVPFVGFVLLLIFIGRFDLEYRILAEPISIVYLSLLIGGRFVPAAAAAQNAAIHEERRLYKNT